MGDLISRKALLEKLQKGFINVNYHPDLGDPAIGMEQELHNEFLVDILEEVTNQPTAYDVDKVVEQLEKVTITTDTTDGCCLRKIDAYEAIKIIKGEITMLKECKNCKHEDVYMDDYPCNECTTAANEKWEQKENDTVKGAVKDE